MLKIFIDGSDDRLRLEQPVGIRVGWIYGHIIGFDGLPSEEVAMQAVPPAWLALERALQRAYPGRTLRPVNKSKIDLVHDGDAEWVAAGFRPLARLIRPNTELSFEDSYALEFLVPSYVTQHVMIAGAQAVWGVMSDYIPDRAENAFRPPLDNNEAELDPAMMAVGGM